MNDLKTDEQCDRCKKPFSILIADFEQVMKDGDLILCSDCETKMLDEQAEAEKPPKRRFQHKTCPIKEIIVNDLGIDGWQLVDVDNGQAYFKREIYNEKSVCFNDSNVFS